MVNRKIIWLTVIPSACYLYFHFQSSHSTASQVSHYVLQCSFLILATILNHITSPLDRWTGPGYALGYFLLYRAGEQAILQGRDSQ